MDPVRWTPFDPDDPSGRLPDLSGAPSGPILILASPGALSGGWAHQAAAGLARGWAAEGRRVLLMDLDLEHPGLHGLLGQGRGMGASDAMLFGASVQSIAKPVEGEAFLFVSSGAPVADPEAVLSSPRWDSVLASAGEAGVTVAAFARTGTPGLESLVQRGGGIVLLGAAGEDHEELARGLEDRLLGILGVSQVSLSPAGQGRDPLAEAGLGGDPLQDAEAEADPTLRSPRNPVPITPLPRDARPARSGGGAFRLLVLAGFLAAAAWVLDVTGVVPLFGPGGGEPEADPAAAPADPMDAEPRAPAVPEGEVQLYSLAMAAFADYERAAQEARRYASRSQEVQFIVAPVEADQGIFWRVLAGPLPDSLAAVALRQVLPLQLNFPSGQDWIVRRTTLAFLLGEHAGLEEARSEAEAFQAQGVPAYVLEVAMSDGSLRYRVYAGAYASPEEAEVLWRALQDTLEARPELVDRWGRIPG